MPNNMLSSVMLSVTGLQKSFVGPGGVIHVLDDASFEVRRGEFLAVVGESGSGKSTLLHVLGSLDAADKGDVVLDGTSLFDLSTRQMASVRNRDIGFIYQAHHLIPELDACENVMLPLLVGGAAIDQAREKAVSMLARLGLAERVRHRPGALSGGEAQRVAVARATVGRPKLILADEPTGNLDEKTADEVFDAMQQLCRKEETSVVMVTHSVQLAAKCDRVLRLKNGRMRSDSENL